MGSPVRLRVASIVADPGESGEAPLPLGNAAVFVFVERGALQVEVDGIPYALGQGDALDRRRNRHALAGARRAPGRQHLGRVVRAGWVTVDPERARSPPRCTVTRHQVEGLVQANWVEVRVLIGVKPVDGVRTEAGFGVAGIGRLERSPDPGDGPTGSRSGPEAP